MNKGVFRSRTYKLPTAERSRSSRNFIQQATHNSTCYPPHLTRQSWHRDGHKLHHVVASASRRARQYSTCSVLVRGPYRAKLRITARLEERDDVRISERSACSIRPVNQRRSLSDDVWSVNGVGEELTARPLSAKKGCVEPSRKFEGFEGRTELKTSFSKGLRATHSSRKHERHEAKQNAGDSRTLPHFGRLGKPRWK